MAVSQAIQLCWHNHSQVYIFVVIIFYYYFFIITFHTVLLSVHIQHNNYCYLKIIAVKLHSNICNCGKLHHNLSKAFVLGSGQRLKQIVHSKLLGDAFPLEWQILQMCQHILHVTRILEICHDCKTSVRSQSYHINNKLQQLSKWS